MPDRLNPEKPRMRFLEVLRCRPLGLTRRTKDFLVLVRIELLELVTCRSEVLAGIELAGLLGEDLADRGGHRETAVGVDVDLADGALGGLAELLFGDTDGVGEFSAVFLDFLDVLDRNRRGSVENDRESGELLLDFGENVKGEGRRNENAVSGAGALGGFELLAAMAGSDGDRERVDAGLLDEVLDFFGLGVVAFLGGNVIFDAGENSEFSLDGDVVFLGMGIIANFLGKRDIFFIREVGSVDHDRGESALDAVLAELEGIAVIEVEDYRDVIAELVRVFDGAAGHVLEEVLVSVLARSRKKPGE